MIDDVLDQVREINAEIAEGVSHDGAAVPNWLLKSLSDLDFAVRERVVLVDVDGTVALNNGRHPFDWSRVDEDSPNWPVIEVVRALRDVGYTIVFLSGREDVCRIATSVWLVEHVGAPFDGLHMRKEGDRRPDTVVKREMFDQHIRGRYDVELILDDREAVVRMWRDELGLTCLQVNDGPAEDKAQK